MRSFKDYSDNTTTKHIESLEDIEEVSTTSNPLLPSENQDNVLELPAPSIRETDISTTQISSPSQNENIANRRTKFCKGGLKPIVLSPSAPSLQTATIDKSATFIPSFFKDFWAMVSMSAQPKKRGDDISLEFLRKIKDLGSGAQASVEMVLDIKTSKYYARKIMRLVSSNEVGEIVTQQILQEIRSYCLSNSPYVVPFYGAFCHDGTVQLLLEYMNAGTLKDLYDKVGKIPEVYLSTIAEQIFLGLKYLHEERQLVHRDIKPSNLLLNLKGDMKIADFGVSRQVSNSNQCQSFTGTRVYMCPQRLNNQRYSFPSDIWSAGVSVLECALGNYPFGPCKPFELLTKIVNLPLPYDEWFVGNSFSPEFRDFIMMCLCKNPAERYSASRLLSHPFITRYKTPSSVLNLGNWITSVIKVEE